MTKAKQAAKTEVKTLGSAEIAKRLKIDPKQFRKILRSKASKANGGARYEFKESDLPKLRKLIELDEDNTPCPVSLSAKV